MDRLFRMKLRRIKNVPFLYKWKSDFKTQDAWRNYPNSYDCI